MVKTGKDGRLYTEADPVAIDLAKARRECLDRIQGNEQFHVDTLGPDKPAAPEHPYPYPYRCACIAGLYLCDACRDA